MSDYLEIKILKINIVKIVSPAHIIDLIVLKFNFEVLIFWLSIFVFTISSV